MTFNGQAIVRLQSGFLHVKVVGGGRRGLRQTCRCLELEDARIG